MDAYLTRIRVPNGFEYTNGDEFELVVEFSGVDPDLVEEAIVYFHLDTTGVSYGLPLNYDDSLGKFTIKGAAEKILQKGKHTLWSISVFDVDGVEHGVELVGNGLIFYSTVEKPVEVKPTVSNVESFLDAGAVDGVGTWWAGLAIDLDKGTYGDIKYIDARWLNIDNSTYGVDTINVRLEEDETGRFAGDTQLHRFYKEGKYELLDLELRNSAGEMVYWIARKEGAYTDEEVLQYLSGGDITLGAENFVGFDPKKYELKVTPVKDVFIDGEDLKFNFSMNIPDGVVFPFKYAFVEVFGTETDEAEFIRVEWDSVKREFNVKDFKNKHTMKYYGVDVYFSNNPNEVISGNRVEDVIFVPLLTNLNFTVKAVEDANIEDLFNKGEEVYEAIEEAIAKLDPTVPEEKAKIEELEKVLRDIDTTKKAVEPEVEKEAPKFVFETANLRALRIEEARDPNVKNISVEVDFEVKTPEEIKELVGEGTAIIGLYDMSLIKRVIKNDDSETAGTIANADILEKITLRLPISRELSERDLKVVYVDADGKITELETRLVAIGEEGKEDFYLQFETDHFSMYGILDVTEPGAPVDPEEPEEPVVDPEEPVVEPEEPVEEPKDPEVKPETPKEKEKVEDKEEETLPKAGSGAVWMYTLSGLALAGAGTFGLKKERK